MCATSFCNFQPHIARSAVGLGRRGKFFFECNGIGGHDLPGENEVALVGDGPLDRFALGKIHALSDGGRKVDVPLLAFLALNELNFGGVAHRDNSLVLRLVTVNKKTMFTVILSSRGQTPEPVANRRYH